MRARPVRGAYQPSARGHGREPAPAEEQRGRDECRGARDGGVTADPAARAPARARASRGRAAAHEGVVAVARLLGQADPRRRGGTGCSAMRRPLAIRRPCAVSRRPRSASSRVGAREALVEAAGRLQRAAPVGQVGGRPGRLAQPGDVALPVRGTAAGRRWDAQPALAARHVRLGDGEVVAQAGAPVRRDEHVVVQEGDPRGTARARPRVAAAAGPRPPERTRTRRSRSAAGTGRPRPLATPGGRSSTTTTRPGSGPRWAASASSRACSEGRPQLGTTTSAGSVGRRAPARSPDHRLRLAAGSAGGGARS